MQEKNHCSNNEPHYMPMRPAFPDLGISYSPINAISEKLKPNLTHAQIVNNTLRFRDPRDPLPAIPNQNTTDLNFDIADLNYKTIQEENNDDNIYTELPCDSNDDGGYMTMQNLAKVDQQY